MASFRASANITGQDEWCEFTPDTARVGIYFSGFAGGTLASVQVSPNNGIDWYPVLGPAGGFGVDDNGKFNADGGVQLLEAVPGFKYRAGVHAADFGSGTLAVAVFG